MKKRTLLLGLIGLLLLMAVGFAVYNSGDVDEPTESSKLSSVTAPVRSKQPEKTTDTTTEKEKPSDTATGDKHPLDPVLELAKQGLVKMRSEVVDYRAKLLKRERVNGRLGGESTMELKVINRKEVDGKLVTPMKVYLKFLTPSSTAGREVIWIEGANNNQLIAHEGGFKNFMRMNLDPEGTIAMLGNRYPLTNIGMERLIEKLIEKGERDRQLGDCEVQIIDGEKVGDRTCQLIQVTHPEKSDKFEFHVAQIFFDKERMIPLRYSAYMWPKDEKSDPPLEEEYTYTDVELTVGLTDEDFNPDNPQYNYPK